MVLTPSRMTPLGTAAPDFDLPDVVSGKRVSLASFAGKKALLVIFLCCHCPYVRHVKEELARIGRDYKGKEIGIVAVSSNDAEKYPEDAPPSLREMAEELGFDFPLCYDESQGVAKAYAAACTPDFFLFARGGLSMAPRGSWPLVYRGQLDDSRPGNGKPVTGRDLRGAIAAALAGRPVGPNQKPSVGCNIKWKPGNEPEYNRNL